MSLRENLFRYRSYTPIPFLLMMLVVAQPTVLSIVAGVAIVASGEFLRLWGVAIAGSETRTTGSVGGSFLVTGGPFGYVRNPLYLGNIAIYFGVGIMSNTPVLALVALVYFIFQYSLIVSLEEEALLEKFGDEYVKYYNSVPRFFPKMKRYDVRGLPQPDFSWKKGFASERRTLQAIGLLIVVQFILWYFRG